MAMTSRHSINCIKDACTLYLPSGDARVAWSNLTNLYEPRDVPEKMKLLDQYTTCKLINTVDLEDWMLSMEEMRSKLINHFRVDISETDFMNRLIDNLPNKHYRYFTNGFIRQMSSKMEPLNMESLKEQLRAYNDTITESNSETQEEERGLYVGDIKKCNVCGKTGHTATNCWMKITCGICNRKGHPTERCWHSEADNINRPDDWVRRSCTFCNKGGHTEEYCLKKK